MITNFSNRLMNTYKDVCSAVNDITLAINGDSKSTSQYRLIPFDKTKKNNFVVNAVEFNTLDETLVFIGPNTIGVKLYSKKHELICSYSVSRKNGIQIVQIQYPDGTGISQRSVFNDYANAYLFDRTSITLDAEDLVDVEALRDNIISEKQKINIVYHRNPDDNQLHIRASLHYDGEQMIGQYSPNEVHSSLIKISNYIMENIRPFIDAHTNCLSLIVTKEFITSTSDFKKAFTRMIRQLEKIQGNHNPEEPNDSFPDTENR